MATVTQIGPQLGIAPTCAALGLPRATYYRRRRPRRAAVPRRPSPRALSPGEREAVLTRLREPRFVDHAPAEIYAEAARGLEGGQSSAGEAVAEITIGEQRIRAKTLAGLREGMKAFYSRVFPGRN